MSTTLESRAAIQALVHAYSWAWDHGDSQAVAECFAPDGVFVDVHGDGFHGREAIAERARRSSTLFGAMRHVTSGHLIELSSPTAATHRCSLLFFHHIGAEGGTRTGEYLDQLRRDAGGSWLFARRSVKFDSQ